jgi:hypothetical protein
MEKSTLRLKNLVAIKIWCQHSVICKEADGRRSRERRTNSAVKFTAIAASPLDTVNSTARLTSAR